MPPSLTPLELPGLLVPHLQEFSGLFPDKVEFDHDSHEVVLKEPGSYGFQVAGAFVSLTVEIGDITSNLDLVLFDLHALASCAPDDPAEGERRYMLLTRLFFYELLRVRDALPRFLTKMEKLNIMDKKERFETRKLLDQQLSEHYQIRNVFLHGHSTPRSANEHNLQLIASLPKYGYEPELRPRDGSEPVKYRELLSSLASTRADALQKIGNDLVGFVQNILNVSAIWISHHKLST